MVSGLNLVHHANALVSVASEMRNDDALILDSAASALRQAEKEICALRQELDGVLKMIGDPEER